jgi:membrane protease subunit HflC
MQAYERSMQHTDTHLVLRPVSDFFRYFGDPSGKSPPEATSSASASWQRSNLMPFRAGIAL